MENFGNTNVEGPGDKNMDTVNGNSTRRKCREFEEGRRGRKYTMLPKGVVRRSW